MKLYTFQDPDKQYKNIDSYQKLKYLFSSFWGATLEEGDLLNPKVFFRTI